MISLLSPGNRKRCRFLIISITGPTINLLIKRPTELNSECHKMSILSFIESDMDEDLIMRKENARRRLESLGFVLPRLKNYEDYRVAAQTSSYFFGDVLAAWRHIVLRSADHSHPGFIFEHSQIVSPTFLLRGGARFE